MNNRVLIVEESLRGTKAHWFSYILTIVKGLEQKNCNVEVISHKDSDEEIKRSFNSYPLFEYAVYLDHDKNKWLGERYYTFILHSLRTVKVLWPFLKRQKQYDEIFVPTVLAQHLLAWWAIMVFHKNKPKRLTLFFVTNPGVWNSQEKVAHLPKSSLLTKFLISLFSSFIKKAKVRLAVETKKAKAEFEQLTARPFALFSHPVLLDDMQPDSSSEIHSPKEILFACFGFARHEKGTDLLKAAIGEILKKELLRNVRFVIQWPDSFKLPDGTECTPGEYILTHPKVTIIRTPLSLQEYSNWLSKTDCMILPYRNSSYHARVSRVAIEAVCLGIPLIYTKDSWLEETVTEFGAGIGIEDENIEQLANGIIKMNEQMGQFEVEANEKISLARRYYSPDFFTETLLSTSNNQP